MNPPSVRDNAAFCSRTRDSEALSAVSSATFSISSNMVYQNEKDSKLSILSPVDFSFPSTSIS